MKKFIVLYAFFVMSLSGANSGANIESGSGISIKNLDEQLINKKYEYISSVVRFKKIASIGLGIGAAIIIGTAVKLCFFNGSKLAAEQDIAQPIQPDVSVPLVVDCNSAAASVSVARRSIFDIPSILKARMVAFVKDFPSRASAAAESTVRVSKHVIIQHCVKTVLTPMMIFFTKDVQGDVDTRWALSKSKFALNLQNIKIGAYKLDPDDTVIFKDKQNIDLPGIADADYADTFAVNVNSLVDGIALFLGLVKYRLASGEQDDQAQILYNHVVKITNDYVNDINTKLASNDSSLALKTTIRFLNALHHDIDSFIVMET